MNLSVFGIRHHGPGSARSLHQALADFAPDIVLVEGPPEGDALLSLIASSEMTPPVALLIYRPDQPAQAAFFPFAKFSPEWRAIQYGLQQAIPVRFMDLPQAQAMALRAPNGAGHQPSDNAETAVVTDPLRWLAEAAGYEDGEAWWERMVEQRRHSADLFTGILEAMAALRQYTEPPDSPRQQLEVLREAAMRRTIRSAQRAGHRQIAVVCGAWHAPALAELPATAKADNELLKGLAKVKVAATWIPWTYIRLTAASGYGAGIVSPRWYEYLWRYSEEAAHQWCIAAARLLRQEGFTASTAQVIDTLRLAETLTAVRQLPTPGLSELMEAAQATLVGGQVAPMLLIRQQLIVGDVVGVVPSDAPTLPLQRDLARWQKKLRLPLSEVEKNYDLDLRQPNDLGRSHLWHRLDVLAIPWARLGQVGRAKGTFHEIWQVQWQPETALGVIEAAVWGNTVATAAAARAIDLASKIDDLPAIVTLVNQLLLANLPEALSQAVTRLETLSALTSDTATLMDALLPLAQILRYGNVRQTDAAMVEQVIKGLVTRICVGLPIACAGLNDDAAEAMHGRLLQTAEAISLLQVESYLVAWQETLRKMADQTGLHGLLAGRCGRLLLDAAVIDGPAAARRLGLALSPVAPPLQAAAWLEGFLRGSGALLLHDDLLWETVDNWLVGLPGPVFQTLLPMLRRTMVTFPPAERRQMGERIRQGPRSSSATSKSQPLNQQHIPLALSVVAQLLGLNFSPRSGDAR